MLTKERALNLLGILATASITGVGFAIGGTIGATIMAGIGINLSSNIIQSGSAKLKERWLSSNDGILNHDIQRALSRAFIKALTHMEIEYFKQIEENAILKRDQESIKALFKELRENAQELFLISLEKDVKKQEIEEYLCGEQEIATDKLWERINGTRLLDTYNTHFKDFLHQNLLNEVQFWFTEELKTDNEECNKAWRAFQRLLLEGIQKDVEAVVASQDLILKDLNTLELLRTQIEQLKDTVDHRLPDEPFQEGLERAFDEMQLVLKRVDRTTQRIEYKVDAIDFNIHTLIKSLDSEKLRSQSISRILGEKLNNKDSKFTTQNIVTDERLGPIIGVPSYPPKYLHRKENITKIEELILDDTVKPVVITSAKQITALQGMGGIGKSVLAVAFARTEEVRKIFYDGIFWINIGLEASESDTSGNMRIIGTTFKDDPTNTNYSNKKQAEASLSKVLSDKVCLIILDNAWKVSQVTPFINALGSRCRLLITARNGDIVTSLDAKKHEIRVLTEPEAKELLASWCDQDINSLPSEVAGVAKECGYLPLALSICGAMAKSGISWSHILEALQEYDFEFFEAELPNYPDKNVGRALKVSIDFLSSEDPNSVKRYKELAILPTNEFVPEAVIATLWAYTGNLRKRSSEKLLTKLKDMSLLRLEGKAPNRLISIHDLQSDYLKAIADDLPGLHNNLLEAYSKECDNKLISGPNDGYFFEHLAYHMKEAGRTDELCTLLLDFEWMYTKLNKELIIQDKTGVKKSNVDSLIDDYDCLPNNKEVGLVQGALKLSANALAKDKKQLSSQLLGRLSHFSEAKIELMLEQAKQITSFPVLFPLNSNLIPPGGSLIRTLEGHSNWIWGVAVTQKDKYAISASGDSTLKVWDIFVGQETKTLTGHGDRVRSVAITEDKIVVSASDDKTLKVWNFDAGLVGTLGNHNKVRCVAVTPSGKYAISGSFDSTLKIWDLKKMSEVKTLEGRNHRVRLEDNSLEGHYYAVWGIAITEDEKYAISASDDRTIKIWDIESGEVIRTLKGHNWIRCVAVTQDQKYVISGSLDKTVEIWDFQTGVLIRTLNGHSGWIRSVAVTTDGKYAVSASEDNTLKVWDIEKGVEVKTLEGHFHPVRGVAIIKDRYIVSASVDETLKIWGINPKIVDKKLKGHSDSVRSIAITKDGKYAISASDDKTIKIWDVKKGDEKIEPLKGHSGCVFGVAVTDDGRYAVSASEDRTLKVWDIETEQKTKRDIRTLIGHADWVWSVAVTKNSKYAVSASDDKTIRVWDLESGEEVRTLEGHTGWVRSVEFTNYEKWIISSSQDGTIRVWNFETGDLIKTLYGNSGWVWAVAATPDGKYAVSASEDKENKVYTIKVWDLSLEKEIKTLSGNFKQVRSVALSQNGNYVVSASVDNSLRVWDIKKDKEIAGFAGDTDLYSCSITPDCDYIAVGDASGAVHFLKLEED